ncbi:MAG: transposase [Patescibacteria group bacterium]|nr:transposase [Patescibacteria group bacterium]
MKKKQKDKKLEYQKKIKDKQRKRLSADAMFGQLKLDFSKISDYREGAVSISLDDALMSAFAMFSLKDSSLLAFDDRRSSDPNLRSIYNIGKVPSDTRMREILDDVSPEIVRPAYKNIFKALQRGKALEPMVFIEGCYLLSVDGTGYFSSRNIHSKNCMEKTNKKTGEVASYYQQMLGAVIVHPNFKEVIPLMPEPIIKQDGQNKNDCERNASKRIFKKIKKDHPKLGIIITEDGLNSNAPHIKNILGHGWHYILGAKEGDHEFLFTHVAEAQKRGEVTEFEIIEEKIVHRFRYLNQVPLNESNQDTLVNFIEYWEIFPEKTQHFSWVTDFTIAKENAYKLMRGGRARWKIENETFNTLKNQGYNFEHNYGLGKNNLSVVFAMLMMLAFLVDQVQQLCCQLFRSTWKKLKSKKALWEKIRALFMAFRFRSMEMIYKALLHGFQKSECIILNTS